MNAQTIDLITLRMAIRSTRKNLADRRKNRYSGGIAQKEYERYLKLMEKYQAWHIQKTGELYYS